MVETSSGRDAFARRSAPATDHFKRKSAQAGGDRFSSGAATFDPARPKQDAFAAKAKPAKRAAAPTEPPARAAAMATPAAPKRGPLRVVASQPEPQPSVDELMFGREELTAADARLRRKAKSSSFVLMTGGGAAAAAASTDTIDAPPPAPAEPAPPPKAEPAPLITETPKRTGGGGGGGGGSDDGGYYGAGAAPAPVRKRGIDQDDIAGIIFGLAVIIFLLLWLFRPKDDGQLADTDPLLSTQFAATDTGPPPPFTPQPDPFGDQPVDLTPKGPIPTPPPEAAPPPANGPDASGGSFSTAQVNPATPPAAAAPPLPVEATPPAAVAPAPATPLALSKLSSNAWFCTGRSDLTDAARADLLQSIAAFKPHAKEPMVVHAYADTRGTSVFNLALSGARARVVADFLRANGLEVIETEGKGELDGLADDQNCANQRRADIFFKSGSELRPSAACVLPPEATPAGCS